MVIEQYKQEELAAKEARQGPKEMGDIDTDDEKDPEAEYESWRSRELRRIRCGLIFMLNLDELSPPNKYAGKLSDLVFFNTSLMERSVQSTEVVTFACQLEVAFSFGS